MACARQHRDGGRVEAPAHRYARLVRKGQGTGTGGVTGGRGAIPDVLVTARAAAPRRGGLAIALRPITLVPRVACAGPYTSEGLAATTDQPIYCRYCTCGPRPGVDRGGAHGGRDALNQSFGRRAAHRRNDGRAAAHAGSGGEQGPRFPDLPLPCRRRGRTLRERISHRDHQLRPRSRWVALGSLSVLALGDPGQGLEVALNCAPVRRR